MRREEAYLLDILIAARKVVQFTQGATREDFQKNEMLHSAVVRQLEIIGEATRNVSQATQDANPTIPWIAMLGLRNLLIHQYFRINLQRLWEISQISVPDLIAKIEPLVPPEEAV